MSATDAPPGRPPSPPEAGPLDQTGIRLPEPSRGASAAPGAAAPTPEDAARLARQVTQEVPPPTSPMSRAPTVVIAPTGTDSAFLLTHPRATPESMQDARDRAGRPFGRYRLLEELGHGGMGIVWKAWDTSLKRVVALKMILATRSHSGGTLDRFLQEARVAAKLRHEHIVGVHDVGEADGQPFFTTDFIAGTTLGKRLEQPVEMRQAVTWLVQVAGALEYAHSRGVLHRDVKPDNVLISEDGCAFVADFGLAKDVELERGGSQRPLTISGALVGTPEYMSPEQASGDPARLGPAVDQFALGALLYEVLTGKPPFHGKALRELLNAITEQEPVPPRSRNPKVDLDLQVICLKMLEKDPLRRYPSLAAVAADLGRWLAGEPIQARPQSWLIRWGHTAWRRRTASLAAGVAVVVAIVALSGAAWLRAHEASARLAALLAEAQEAERALAAAGEAQREELARQARDRYGAVIGVAPDHAEARAARERLDAQLQEWASTREQQRQAREAALQSLDQAQERLASARRAWYDRNAGFAALVRKVDAAQSVIEQALRQAPELPRAHLLLGQAWELKGREDLAEQAYRDAITLDPAYGPAQFRLGQLLLFQAFLATATGEMEAWNPARRAARKQIAGARQALQAAMTASRQPQQDDESKLWREAIRALQAWLDGGAVVALAVCRRALTLEDEDGREVVQWLMGWSMPGDAGLRLLDEAIERRPHFPIALYCRAMRLAWAGQPERALADLDAALEFAPRLVPALVNRADLRLGRNETEGALADLERALELDPQCTAALDLRAGLWRGRGEWQRAEADHHAVIELAPDSWWAWFRRSLTRRLSGNLRGATEDLTAAMARTPGRPEVLAARGHLRLLNGAWEEAEEDFRAALAAGGDTWPMRTAVAAELDVAAATAQQAKAGPPVSAAARGLWGAQFALQVGDLAAARSLYEDILAAPTPAGTAGDPGRSVAHYNLACLWARTAAGRLMPSGEAQPPPAGEAAACLDRCFEQLRLAIQAGWADAAGMEQDEDLAPARRDARWQATVAAMRAK